MGIDRIGSKGPSAVPVNGAGPASGAAFEAPKPAATSEASGVTKSSPLQRLQAGEINVAQYVDLKVDEATAHLRDLSPDELRSVRAVLRDRIAVDPALSDLVRTATGSVPKPPRDDE